MHIVIKVFASGKRQHCRLSTLFAYYALPLLLLLGSIYCALFVQTEAATVFTNASNSEAIDGVRPWNLTVLDRLRLQLFTNYDKNSHPTYHGVPTNITLGMSINYIDIDEIEGKMTLHAWLRIRWMDDNRSWNAKDYENATNLHLKPKEVWKPDITLFNSAGGAGDYLGDTQILLAKDGSFLWVPPVVYSVYCNLNLLLWPYDAQTCKVKVGSWTMTNIDPLYLSLKESLDYDELVKSTEWEIMQANAKYFRYDYYNYVEFTFQLQRRSSMYGAVIFTPATCIILLSLCTFWLPPQMGEKILLNGIVIVVIAAFLMYFAQLLPILADNTPLIVHFYSGSLLLLSISTIVAVFVLYLSTSKHKQRVPDFLKNLLNGRLGSILLLGHFTLEAEPQSLLSNNGISKELSENVFDDASTTEPVYESGEPALPTNRSIQFDWILLATALDRISFIIYCLVFMLLAIAFSV